MSRTITSSITGHTLHVASIDFEDLPQALKNVEHVADFDSFYVVRNWNADGVAFFYLAKSDWRRMYYGLFGNGQMWTGTGSTMKETVEGMQRDGWMYTYISSGMEV